MEIIPRLYLTNNTKNIPNGSVVSANNIILNNNNLLQVSYGHIENNVINECIENKCNNKNYEIKHCLECPEELIIFVKIEDYDNLLIFRYNEKENKCIYIIDSFEYSGGKLISTYTYNKNNLIISISEYDDENNLNIPLRLLNLGEFNEKIDDEIYKVLNNNKKHPIIPEIKIPTLTHDFVEGHAYKGWHYVFIRYMITYEDYTQWYFTNYTIFLDDFNNKLLTKYISRDEDSNLFYNSYVNQVLSEDNDICQKTYKLFIDNLDKRYDFYQICVMTIFKSQIRSFISENLSIDKNSIIFYKFKEYNYTELLEKYNNYYNVKTLDSFNNKLYIGNYLEKSDYIDISGIELTLNAFEKKIDETFDGDIEEDDTVIKDSISAKFNKTNEENIIVEKNYYNDINGKQIEYIKGVGVRYETNTSYTTYIYLDNLTGSNFVYLIFDLYKLTSEGSSTSYLPKGHYIVKTTPSNLCIINDNRNKYFENFKLTTSHESSYFITPWNKFNKTPTKDQYGFHPSISDIKITIYTQEEFENTEFSNVDLIFDDTDNATHSALVYENYEYHNTTTTNLLDYNYNHWDWNYINKPEDDVIESFDKINKLNRFGIDINEYYSFYIHFINKYGEISKGISINKFSLILNSENITAGNNETPIDIKTEYNIKGKKLIYFKSNEELLNLKTYKNDCIYIIKSKINKFPENYIGYFVSYEEIDKRIQYKGFGKSIINDSTNNFEFYCEKLNIDDTINLNINEICYQSITFNTSFNNSGGDLLRSVSDNYIGDINISKINNKNLFIANDIETNNKNIGSTKLKLDIDVTYDTERFYFCMLLNNNYFNKYINESNLIVCSNISYNIEDVLIINTKNAISTTISYLYYLGYVYFDDATLKFKNENDNNDKIIDPYYLLNCNFYDELPYETLIFKNKPAIKVFPASNNTYKKGKIIELKNTIDLYKQNHIPYYKTNIFVLDYFKDDIKYINKFTNTIRRSDGILDESYKNNWRIFRQNIYKNVSENKGDIIKIENINNSMIIHAKYGLFILDGSDSIKTFNDGKIQLASIDIWDINIKELVSSKLGYGGLENSKLSVSGEYGYVWYNDHELFLMNNNFQIKKITDDIKDLLGDGENNIKIDSLFNDKKNNTILINFVDKDKSLIYNYKSNTFISFVDKLYDNVYNTKSNTYIINNNKLFNYDLNNNISKLNNKSSSISIIFNENYNKIKILENIIYKIKNKIINDINDIIHPTWLQNKIQYYAGDKIRVFSQFADTDYLNIILSDDEINKENSTKPYWHLGNWNFNNLRNKIKDNEINLNLNDNEQSLIYGNYFIVTFVFESNNLTHIESIDFNIKLI